MKKLNLLMVASIMSVGMMMVSCGASDSSDKNATDSVAQTNSFGDPEAIENKPSREKETVSLGGKMNEVSGVNISKESIKRASNVVFIEVGDKALAETALLSGDISTKYDGKAEFIYANFDKNPNVMKEFGVAKTDVPVIIVADKEGNFEKFTGTDAKAKAEEKLNACIKK